MALTVHLDEDNENWLSKKNREKARGVKPSKPKKDKGSEKKREKKAADDFILIQKVASRVKDPK